VIKNMWVIDRAGQPQKVLRVFAVDANNITREITPDEAAQLVISRSRSIAKSYKIVAIALILAQLAAIASGILSR